MPEEDYRTGPGPIDPHGGSGALRAVGIVLVALGGAAVLVCAGGAYWLAQNETVRAGFDALVAARDAPGAEELRAAGCDEAMVMDSAVFLDMADGLAKIFGGETVTTDVREVMDGIPATFVVCTFSGTAQLGCDDVGRVFRDATGPVEPFVAQVSRANTREVCQEVFGADGESLGDLESWLEKFDDSEEHDAG